MIQETTNEPYERFEEFAKALMAVPKKELRQRTRKARTIETLTTKKEKGANMAEPNIKITIANVKFDFTIGLLVTVNFNIREANEQKTLVANGSLEVVVKDRDKDWTVSELKTAAIDQAYATLETLLSHR